ncbi:type II secretion system protein GspC [Sorangium sp. So ce1151]|uniref:type II secretion system protein GspC n=1 Tax=Sorangium sp. So ce1151 TaxID=3133332 RepID=UPI003F6238C8
MGIDAILKRYFPWVLGVLIALAAYFQASGMGQLVASSVAVDAPPPPPPSPPSRAGGLGSSANTDHATSAGAILSRNPFDSVTGPLDGKPVELPNVQQEMNNKDPYADPSCDGARVLLITQAEDPAWSFAAMAGSDGKAILRRQGDEISGQTVYYVGWDRVWLTSGSSRCQAIVGGHNAGARASAAATPAPAAPAATSTSKAPARGGKKVPPEIASKIQRVSETEFNVERSAVDQILENQGELMRSARIVPEKEGDKVVGIRLFGIRPDSLLGTLGLENGDRLSSINGFEMSDPQKALEAYARLRTADRLTVSVNRKGKPMNIDFNIK